jgi:hypothetical protein
MTYKIVPIRATGLTPEAVSEELERELNNAVADGWTLDRIQPIIYNSSTTGYLLVILTKDGESA